MLGIRIKVGKCNIKTVDIIINRSVRDIVMKPEYF